MLFPPESTIPVRLYCTVFLTGEENRIPFATASAVIALESVTFDPLIATMVVPEGMPEPDTIWPKCKLRGDIVAGSVKIFLLRSVFIEDFVSTTGLIPTLLEPVVSSMPVTLL